MKWRALSLAEQAELLLWATRRHRHARALGRAYIKHMLIDELIRLAT